MGETENDNKKNDINVRKKKKLNLFLSIRHTIESTGRIIRLEKKSKCVSTSALFNVTVVKS